MPRAARRVVAALAVLGSVSAERYGHMAPERPAGRRPLATLAVLLGAAGLAHAADSLDAHAHLTHKKLLDLDSNGDGKLSMEEYLQLAGPDADFYKRNTLAAVFRQADIDDNDELALAEFLFAGYIEGEERFLDRLKAVADKLPPGFPHRIDKYFSDVRARSKGKAYLHEILRDISKAVGMGQGELDSSSRKLLRRFFVWADVTKDGRLNLNELDLFHYMVRESMTEALLRDSIEEGPSVGALVNEKSMLKVDAFFKEFDKNGNGKLEEEEAVEGLSRHFGDTPAEREIYAALLRDAFSTHDVDRDRGLDPREARRFFDALTQR